MGAGLVGAAIFAFAPAAFADGDEPGPTVHVDAPAAVTLEAKDAGTWTPVCAAPCDLTLSTHVVYRIAGPGVLPSDPFLLRPDDGGNVHLVPHVATRGRQTAGWIMVASGMLGVLAGGFLTVYASGANTCDRPVPGYGGGPPCNTYVGWRDASIGVMVGGGLTAVVGAVLAAVNGNASRSTPYGDPPRSSASAVTPSFGKGRLAVTW